MFIIEKGNVDFSYSNMIRPALEYMNDHYNEAMVTGSGAFIAPMALSLVDAEKQPARIDKIWRVMMFKVGLLFCILLLQRRKQ